MRMTWPGAWRLGTASIDRTSIVQGIITAAATVLVVASGTAAAMSHIATVEDEAQLKADRAALNAEITQLRSDEKKLKDDGMAGRMAAVSPDTERVYLDRQAIKGQGTAIASDKQGSLQMKADKAALAREESQLRLDRQALQDDSRTGKMSAMSQDAEGVYKDRLNITGERKEIAADIARLKADEKG